MGPTGPGYTTIAAPNEAFWDNSAKCGTCYEIDGPLGTVKVMVTDVCPVSGNAQWCSGDITHFDLSQGAFQAIAPLSMGITQTIWRYDVLIYQLYLLDSLNRPVTCEITGPVKLKFKDGSNLYWFAILIFNHRGKLIIKYKFAVNSFDS